MPSSSASQRQEVMFGEEVVSDESSLLDYEPPPAQLKWLRDSDSAILAATEGWRAQLLA
jgi:hypothetical protein